MKTYGHLWQIVEFLLELEIFRTKVVKQTTTYILWSINLFRKSCCLFDSVEK
jgi:hypothetical protein